MPFQHRPPVAGEDRNTGQPGEVAVQNTQHRPPVAGEDRNNVPHTCSFARYQGFQHRPPVAGEDRNSLRGFNI